MYRKTFTSQIGLYVKSQGLTRIQSDDISTSLQPSTILNNMKSTLTLITLAAATVSQATACPGSASWIHAKCEMEVS